MPLTPGTRVGAYEVVALLGSGGMGEVWRAIDTRLKRQVALKVLPAALASDPERIARFQREAEVLAALNHPNIAQIHGIEEAGGVTALVLELVEGPTLADRIAQGPIPGPGGPIRISTAGGNFPRWRGDGRELFYLTSDGRVMAVPTATSGQKIDAGTPTELFRARVPSLAVVAGRPVRTVARRKGVRRLGHAGDASVTDQRDSQLAPGKRIISCWTVVRGIEDTGGGQVD